MIRSIPRVRIERNRWQRLIDYLHTVFNLVLKVTPEPWNVFPVYLASSLVYTITKSNILFCRSYLCQTEKKRTKIPVRKAKCYKGMATIYVWLTRERYHWRLGLKYASKMHLNVWVPNEKSYKAKELFCKKYSIRINANLTERK